MLRAVTRVTRPAGVARVSSSAAAIAIAPLARVLPIAAVAASSSCRVQAVVAASR